MFTNNGNHKNVDRESRIAILHMLSNCYLTHAFSELYKDDGLLVVGKGLGIQTLLIKFLKSYSISKTNKKTVLCLNMPEEHSFINSSLFTEGLFPNQIPKVINSEIGIADRTRMYEEGGCFIVTSRITIHDILKGIVNANDISGFLVFDAHEVHETSLEAFIIRVFKAANPDGFIKAFSDNAENLINGFSHTERILRNLHVKKLYLYPRYRQEVCETLQSRNTPEVIELLQPLNRSMKQVQGIILVIIESCIKELKRAVPHLDATNLTLDNGVFYGFDVAIRKQLDPEWHTLSYRAKQLIGDIKSLRQLLDFLIRYDAVTFYSFLLTIKNTSNSENSPSLWLTSSSANLLFECSRNRVLSSVPINNGQALNDLSDNLSRSGLSSKYVPVLEVPPKWNLLMDILKEIKDDYKVAKVQIDKFHPATPFQSTASTDEETVKDLFASSELLYPACAGSSSREEYVHKSNSKTVVSEESSDDVVASCLSTIGRIIIVVKDERSQSQIVDCIFRGGEKVIEQRLRHFVTQQAVSIRRSIGTESFKKRKLNASNNKSKNIPTSFGGTSGSNYGDSRKYQKSSTASKVVGTIEDMNEVDDFSTLGSLPITSEQFKNLHPDQQMILLMEKDLYSGDEKSTDDKIDTSNVLTPKTKGDSTSMNSGSVSAVSSFTDLKVYFLDPSLHIMVLTQDECKKNPLTFSNLQPSYVVLVDPDVEIIRMIETYQASMNSIICKVYFFMYAESVEEHRYTEAIRRDKKAFEELSRKATNLVISFDDFTKDSSLSNEDISTSSNFSSTFSSSASANPRNNKIIIDIREFGSSLPSLIHRSGMKIDPVTLQVGDYILSPQICVERKGISDMFQSFASGRLYTQMEAMSRHYQLPCLLIEFSPDASFSLQSPNEISSEIQISNICSKISLLALAFPSMSILWSRSPHASVSIFKSIKTNFEDADVNRAVSIGGEGAKSMNDHNTTADDVTDAVDTQMVIQNILLSLPGVNVQNYRSIMNSVADLAELSNMSVKQLIPLIGPVNAKKLFTFFMQSS